MKAEPENPKKVKSTGKVWLPTSLPEILRKREALKKELLRQENLLPVRIAILGGSTTSELRKMLELFLLASGIQPAFYESGYNRYRDDVLFESPELWQFKPDIVFFHTTWRNVSQFPELLEGEAQVQQRVEAEMARFTGLWEKVHSELDALILQNNFDLPNLRLLGNLDATQSFGRANFLMRLNAEFAGYASSHSHLLISDIHYLAAEIGLDNWAGSHYWYNFHMAISPAATLALSRNLAGMLQAVYGRSRKCLVLDLDNTLWGGVIGDDGVQNLLLGRDHPLGEAYLDFQQYVKDLKRRGILLAVCSKNEPENAREGFTHPDSILKLEDFSAFKANWNAKPENIRAIAAELNIGLDSLVFVDDNPAERALVAEQLPEVAVPDMGADVAGYSKAIERERYFELTKLVADDLSRSDFYSSNATRASAEASFADYGEFLSSLDMSAEIGPFIPVYLERITQLINKTNQFNLTTRRYTSAEVQSMASDPDWITLYGRLADRFGDNGLVSVIAGRVQDNTLEIDLWLMSCRVFKREMEFAMFDALVERCHELEVRKIVGVFIPSKKNAIVGSLYASLGFLSAGAKPNGETRWEYVVPRSYEPRNHYIRRSANALMAVASA
jgi:FkbH-like protein